MNEEQHAIFSNAYNKRILPAYEKYQADVSLQKNATPWQLVLNIVSEIGGLDGKDVAILGNYDVACVLAALEASNGLGVGTDYNFKSLTLLTDVVEFDPNLKFNDKFKVVVDNLNEPAKIDMMGKKFDVVIGNPPYQKGKTSIWQKFTNLGLSVLKDGGSLAMIHPASYRLKGKHQEISDYFSVMKGFYIQCLQLSNYQTGKKLFGDGATTTADWYIVVKEEANGRLTTVTDVDGDVEEMDLSDAAGVPDVISLDKDVVSIGDDCLEIVTETSDFHTQSKSDFLDDFQSEEFKYPAVYSLKEDGPRMKWSSRKPTKQDFGPKIILANGMGKPVLDLEGEIGLTQFASAILGEPEELKKIYAGLCTDECVKVIQKAGGGDAHKYSKVGVGFLKKGFYKKFQD